MADVSTEVAIATYTLGSTAASIDFTSIPSTYTDLRVVLIASSSAGIPVYIRFNSDTGNNYSKTYLYGNGSSAGSGSMQNQTGIATSYSGLSSTIPSLLTYDVFSYAGSTYKTVLASDSQDQNGAGSSVKYVGLWSSTSAITSVNLVAYNSSYTFAAGTTATLYGIL